MNGDGPEMDHGSSYASEKTQTESTAVERSKGMRRHNQILRIRAEDLHVGEDVANFMLSCSSRPMLPASPLSQSRRA